ncbi:mannose-6-phosphate isomerase [Gluconacetobacter tumulicola]|uniref:Mannose-6-phosphate isomerase n=2 Tax=Gluconacetobacter tumulicola TaxID=1017177 RepID=A0A7W4P6B9_9PROT|nr:AGE family epimerase/isomerase [Gluconacetobacter tumulicola]MBB2179186.1 mannose-6-phosphate isomerase [Gluconacetobacter tumulicola]
MRHALPLWSEQGFNSAQGLYHERLTWDGTPVSLPQRRLMVQARQIATYCRAGLDGLYDTSAPELAKGLRCLETVERLYWRADDGAGWIFSLAPDGTPASPVRDLYAHAFILFAYAWAYRLTGAPRYRRVARETAEETWQLFALEGEGFRDRVPQANTVRRQNPHMHLLEACLALFEATNEAFYLDQAERLVALASRRFMGPRSGALLEEFDAAWVPLAPPGHNRVEPGHLFEWAWLLGEYRRLAPEAEKGGHLCAMAERLFVFGSTEGCAPDTGLVYDAMTEDGVVFEHSTRIWPQTELLRLLCRRRKDAGEGGDALLSSISTLFFTRYAPARLAGGWIDRLDEGLAPMVDHMPASSLYHIYGAAREIICT